MFFHSVQLTWSHAVCPAAVRRLRNALSSTFMSQKNVAAWPSTVGKSPRNQRGQVDQVDPLVDEFAPAGELGVRPPFAVVALSAAVAVAPAQEHEGAKGPGVDDLARLLRPGWNR